MKDLKRNEDRSQSYDSLCRGIPRHTQSITTLQVRQRKTDMSRYPTYSPKRQLTKRNTAKIWFKLLEGRLHKGYNEQSSGSCRR